MHPAILWVIKYASGGLVSYITPRLLVASGVPLDRWIVAVGGGLHIDREVALWAASFIVAAVLYGGSIVLSKDHDWRPTVPIVVKRLWAKVRLEPSYMIIGGLVVIVIGVLIGGAMISLGIRQHSQDAAETRKITQASPPTTIAALPQALSNAAAPSINLPQAKRRLSSIDYDERRRVLNTFYKHVNGPIRDTYTLAWYLYNDQPRLINENQKAVFEELKKIRQQMISEWQELVAPLVRVEPRDGDPNFCTPHWRALSLSMRRLWWRETDYSRLPPSPELIEVARNALKELKQ